MEKSGNQLRQPRTLEIRRATSWAGLYNGNNTIRRHMIPLGEVSPVIFDCLPTWWFMNRGGVPERFLVIQTWFFDEFRLFDVELVDSKRFFTVAAIDRK